MIDNERKIQDWFHLKGYGYAPGEYMSQCHRCKQIVANLDKRAITCLPCAEAMDAEFPRSKDSEKTE